MLLLSHSVVSDSFTTPYTIAHQACLFMVFPKQEYWSGLPFPSPGDLPNSGIKSVSPALQAHSLPLSHQGRSSISQYLPIILSLGSICSLVAALQPKHLTSIQNGDRIHTKMVRILLVAQQIQDARNKTKIKSMPLLFPSSCLLVHAKPTSSQPEIPLIM